ncbi:MAG TPA: peptidoglycan-associated lipoprotein Pal [Terracidiphilus sp.]|nr:peptidoglycan-associated lipoprotein Pal [Terracidiphilus sp.]
MKNFFRVVVPVLLCVALIAVAGCKKKEKPLPAGETAPPPAAPAPTAVLSATPSSISAGDQAVLTWKTTDATNVSIEGIGDVPTTGVKTVTPASSTTYHLVARGEGGSADATARVTVTQPPAAVPVPSNTMSAEEEFKANVQDIFFDYDTADIRTDAQATLSKDATYLVSHPNIKVVIGGYCDERGSNEYNLALGQNRAEAAKNAIVNAGVAANRVRVISYGKEKPFCTESTEDCWQQNRRDGFSVDQ